MLALGMISWWYSSGWKIFFTQVSDRFKAIVDYFSFATILRTLFAPFRQIDAGSTLDRSLSGKLRASFDRLFSRIMGAIVRSIILCAGLILMTAAMLLSLSLLIIWPLIPLSPFVAIALAISGVSL